MKVKIFSQSSGNEKVTEDKMNEWFKRNSNISIFKIKLSGNLNRFVTQIYYTDTNTDTLKL
jgi:hypothetical protein